MAVVKNLMVRAGADFSAMKKEMQKASGDLKAFKGKMTSSLKGLGAVLGALGIGAVIKDAVKSAMDVEAAMQQINRTMGTSAQAFNEWAKTTGAAFNLSTSDAMKYGAVFSNLISGFTSGTGQIAQRTEDMLKTSAVVASATGRTMDDVMERIRSGMLGETDAIEDLGINVNNAMILSTDAFKRFAGDRSWNDLSYQTQQTILYFAILEQASKKYGVSLADNTNTRQAQFVASLKNVQLALGQAFLPIYNAILPALTQLASSLATVIGYVAQFMNALFGTNAVTAQTNATDAQTAAVSGLGDAYKAAGDKAKKASQGVANFDEVNNLSSSGADGAAAAAASAGGAAGAGKPGSAGNGPGAISEISSKIKQYANNVRAYLKGLWETREVKDWLVQVNKTWQSMKGFAQSLADFWNTPAVQKVIGWLKDSAWSYFWNQVNTNLKIMQGAFDAWKGWLDVLTGIMSLDGHKTATGLTEIWNAYKLISEGLIGKIFPGFTWEKLGAFFATLFEKVVGFVGEGYTAIGRAIKLAWNDIVTGEYWNNIVDSLDKVWTAIKQNVAEMWQPIGSAVSTAWGLIVGAKFWSDAADTVSKVWTTIKNAVSASFVLVGTAISDAWAIITSATFWNNVATTVSGLWTTIKNGVAAPFVLIGTAVSNAWKLITGGEFWKNVVATVAGLWTAIKDAIPDAFKLVGGAVDSAWETIVKSVKDSINTVIGLVNSMIDKINGISIDIPKVDLGPLGSYGGGKVGGFSIPHLPPLAARGGIVDGPTNFGNFIAGEAGKEMIVPLENTSFTDKIASALGTAVMNAMQVSGGSNSSANRELVLQLDGVTIARVLNPYSAKENQRIGGAMIRTT